MNFKLPSFNKGTVLVVGDVMLDRYWYVLMKGISNEAPVPIVDINKIENRPGGAANVAMNIATLGANVNIIGLTGNDDDSSLLARLLNELNIKNTLIPIDDHKTIIKLRVISNNQQLIRLDFEKKFNNISHNTIENCIMKYLKTANVLLLSDYGKGTLKNINSIIELAKPFNIPILIDPKGKDFSRYYGATLLTPNLSEFEQITGKCINEKEIIDNALRMILKYNFSALLITLAENGMILIQPGKVPLHLEAQAQDVYDVTGAGDTVIGVLASAIAAGYNLEDACYFANISAGIVVKKLGTATLNITELENAMHSKFLNNFGIVNENQLQDAIFLARKRGEKIVMTNGIFDILHIGHIKYLSKARNLGDRLIVAVNSDLSTSKLKGPNRPINSLKNRMILLAALESVDWVISFNEDTPTNLISKILPDLLVKGGDYKLHQIEGAKEVLDNGGRVKILNFENDISTSKIIRKIRKK